MKNTNSTDYKNALRAYLLPIIEQKMEDYGTDPATVNPWQWVIDTARAEIPHEFERHGIQGGVEYWLSGVALNVAVYNSDIVRVCEQLHGHTLTDKQAETCIAGWFRHLAAKIVQFSRT